jgi:hypothetical protein
MTSKLRITDVWLHGCQVVQDGRIATLDEAELVGQVRAPTRGWWVWAGALCRPVSVTAVL